MKQGEVFKWALVGVGLYAVYRVGQKLGLFSTTEEQKIQASTTAPIWGGTTITPGTVLLPRQGAEFLARQIYDAKGIFNDDEEQIYSAFRSIRYKTQVRSIADAFKDLFKQDLFFWLKDVLSEKEFNNVLTIIDSKQ